MIDEKEFPLRKFVAPEFIFGMDARRLAGRYAVNFGARKVLLVTDPGLIAAGWTDDVAATLAGAGLEYTVFSGVSSNPKSEEVMEGAEIYRREGCNALVVVGGGSPIDCAKGIGIVSSNRKDITEFEGVDRIPLPGPPLICVPTTAGSSADVSQFAIITDSARRVKMALVSKMLVPDVALIDPVTTVTMPPDLTVWTGMDALCHAIEAYVSTAHSPVTDVHALEAIRLVTANLLRTVAEPENPALRGRMMLASLEAGLAFSNASLGAVHAMAHSIGGIVDSAAHGECNAILLPHVIGFNFEAVPERYVEIGMRMGLDARGMTPEGVLAALVERIDTLNRAAGVAPKLTEVGVRREDIPAIAERAMNDPCMVTNPREPTLRDIEELYEKAF
jgi:alcohol dehydrogenase